MFDEEDGRRHPSSPPHISPYQRMDVESPAFSRAKKSDLSLNEKLLPRSPSSSRSSFQLVENPLEEAHLITRWCCGMCGMGPVSRLFLFLRPERWWIVGATLFSCLQVAVALTQPRLNGFYFSALVDDSSSGTEYLWIMACFYVAQMFLTSATSILFGITAAKLTTRSRLTLMRNYLARSMGFFDRRAVGELLSRLNTDAAQLSILTTTISSAINILSTSIGSLVWMFSIDAVVSTVVIGAVPILFLLSLFFGRIIRQRSRILQDLVANQNTIATETLQNIRTVRCYDQETRELNRYAGALVRMYKIIIKILSLSQIYSFLSALFLNAATVIVLFLGGNKVDERVLTIGDLYSFISYAGMFTSSTKSMSSLYTDIQKVLGGTVVLLSLLQPPKDDLDYSSESGDKLRLVEGEIQFRNVTFSYPSRPSHQALHHVSFDVPPRCCTAIVGASGSGKSSIFSLLLRFYEISDGSILLDGVDIRSLDKSWLRQNISIVSQDPVIFSGTIRENIAYGRLECSDEEVLLVARAARAHDFIVELPKGYETRIGSSGTSLSGGQKQRIAIARALLKNSQVLLLDEATNSLDPQSESAVHEALREISLSRTVVNITHRIGSVQQWSKHIIVLSDGKVVEEGSHEELMQRHEGLYSSQIRASQSMDVETVNLNDIDPYISRPPHSFSE